MPDLAQSTIDSEEECFVVEKKKKKKEKKAKYERGYYKGKTSISTSRIFCENMISEFNQIISQKCTSVRKKKKRSKISGRQGRRKKSSIIREFCKSSSLPNSILSRL